MSSTFLELFCELLKGLPNDFARELANVQRLDRQVEDLKPKMESSMASALNICHSNRKLEGPELAKLLQHLKTEREGEIEALRLTVEKIGIFDHTITTINSYMDRLEEDIERYEDAVDDVTRHQAAVEEAKIDGTYQGASSSNYGNYPQHRPSTSGSGGYSGSYPSQMARSASTSNYGGGAGSGGNYHGYNAPGGAGAGGYGGYGASSGGYSNMTRRSSGMGVGGNITPSASTTGMRPGKSNEHYGHHMMMHDGSMHMGADGHSNSGSSGGVAHAGAGSSGASGGSNASGVVYCICGSSDTDDTMMIGCDNKKCLREWFHLECVGLKKPPQGAWYCDDCTRKGFKA